MLCCSQHCYSFCCILSRAAEFAFSINTQVIIQNRARSHWLAISDYQSIITSTDKMAASSRFATVSQDDFASKCFFFSFLK